jgi:hypothetical protein
VRLHRIREPSVLRDQTVPSRTFRFTYADRPHNAEALLADPGSSRLWVVTKQLAHGSLYALPRHLSRSRVNVARRVRVEDGLVTDGAIDPNGGRYVLRDYVDAVIYEGLPPGSPQQRIYLPFQLQGEAIAWTPEGRALLIAGERDDRLLRVAVPAAEATATASASPVPDPTVGDSAPDSGPVEAASSGAGLAFPAGGVITLVLVAAAGLAIASAGLRRRRRRGE